ncbi:hypothetical protein N0V86_004197 [Didymella sp. IMI 355093]|nr:hypothetical protein N0V86_004197 [Didymella sp. IMI 355093]
MPDPQVPTFTEEDAPPPLRDQFHDERDEMDYWRRIEEYKKTQLHKFYLEEMQRVCPEWVQIHKTEVVKAGFDFAVHTVSLGTTVAFELWLKQTEQDQEPFAFRDTMS